MSKKLLFIFREVKVTSTPQITKGKVSPLINKPMIIKKPNNIGASKFCTNWGWQHGSHDKFCGGCGQKRI